MRLPFETSVDDSTVSIVELQRQATVQSRELGRVQHDVQQFKASSRTQDDELADLRRSLGESQSDIRALNDQFSRIYEHTSSIHALKQALAAQTVELDHAKQDLSLCKDRFVVRDINIIQVRGELERSKADIGHIKQDLLHRLREGKARMADVQGRLNEQRGELSAVHQEISTFESSRRAQDQELTELHQAMVASHAEVRALKEELEHMEAEAVATPRSPTWNLTPGPPALDLQTEISPLTPQLGGPGGPHMHDGPAHPYPHPHPHMHALPDWAMHSGSRAGSSHSHTVPHAHSNTLSHVQNHNGSHSHPAPPTHDAWARRQAVREVYPLSASESSDFPEEELELDLENDVHDANGISAFDLPMPPTTIPIPPAAPMPAPTQGPLKLHGAPGMPIPPPVNMSTPIPIPGATASAVRPLRPALSRHTSALSGRTVVSEPTHAPDEPHDADESTTASSSTESPTATAAAAAAAAPAGRTHGGARAHVLPPLFPRGFWPYAAGPPLRTSGSSQSSVIGAPATNHVINGNDVKGQEHTAPNGASAGSAQQHQQQQHLQQQQNQQQQKTETFTEKDRVDLARKLQEEARKAEAGPVHAHAHGQGQSQGPRQGRDQSHTPVPNQGPSHAPVNSQEAKAKGKGKGKSAPGSGQDSASGAGRKKGNRPDKRTRKGQS